MLPERGRDGLPHLRVGSAGLPDVVIGIPGSPDVALVRMRLARLLQWLDRQLNSPISIEAGPRIRTVWAFGLFGYRIDSVGRTVRPVQRVNGRVFRQPYTVELLRPLRSPDWLPFILRDLGLSDYGPQRHLFLRDRSIRVEENWIAREAFRRLLRDQRFRELRRRLLPSALALEPRVLRIAHACRDPNDTGIVSSARYSLVWRHERAFRTVAQENPRLLPLAFSAVEHGDINPGKDLVAQLHDGLRVRGLPRRSWRYLAQHGGRFLLPVLQHFGGSPVTIAAAFLRALSAAGISLPPSDRVRSFWLRNWPDWMGLPEQIREGDKRGVPSFVVSAYLREALRVAGTSGATAWVEETPVVLKWAAETQPQPDKRQRRAGWPWLLRKALDWDRRRILLEHEGPREWACLLERYDAGGYRATAIRTIEELVDEGAAFQNCLGNLAGECQSGTARFFAVRCARTGVRVAVAAVAWHSERRGWALGDLKGPANTEVQPPVLEFAGRLATEYARRVAHLPSPPSDPIAELFDEAAREVAAEEAHALSHQAPILVTSA